MNDARLVSHWMERVRDDRVRSGLRRVYAIVAGEVHLRAPVCGRSGRCCRFEAWEHRLYVTGLETAWALLPLPPVRGGPGEGPSPTAPAEDNRASRAPAKDAPRPTLSRSSLDAARARGGCPFQRNNLCTIHSLRPLACRLYYCDPRWEPWQSALAERTHAAIREIHDAHEIEYRYGEWRDVLEMFVEVGVE